ncbi:MAG: hypothetical protein IT310_02620 [Anaerolineales bacterium]|nr:hypothetical protein [Anaerolineales bacterium]
MQSTREYWPRWAESLRLYQLHELMAAVLEAGSPLAFLGAQAIYFGRVFVRTPQLTALAEMLEEESEVQAFASFIKEEQVHP